MVGYWAVPLGWCVISSEQLVDSCSATQRELAGKHLPHADLRQRA